MKRRIFGYVVMLICNHHLYPAPLKFIVVDNILNKPQNTPSLATAIETYDCQGLLKAMSSTLLTSTDGQGRTALHLVATPGKGEKHDSALERLTRLYMMEILLQSIPDTNIKHVIDIPDNGGRTALYRAVKHDQAGIARALKDKGAKEDLQCDDLTRDGEKRLSPYKLAQKSRSPEMRELFGLSSEPMPNSPIKQSPRSPQSPLIVKFSTLPHAPVPTQSQHSKHLSLPSVHHIPRKQSCSCTQKTGAKKTTPCTINTYKLPSLYQN